VTAADSEDNHFVRMALRDAAGALSDEEGPDGIPRFA